MAVSFIYDGGNQRKPSAQVADKLYHIMLYWVHTARPGFDHTMVIGTECIGRSKFNYTMITAMTAPY